MARLRLTPWSPADRAAARRRRHRAGLSLLLASIVLLQACQPPQHSTDMRDDKRDHSPRNGERDATGPDATAETPANKAAAMTLVRKGERDATGSGTHGARLANEVAAIALMRAGNYDAAARALEIAAVPEPDNARLHYLHGLALLAVNKCGQAAVALDRAVRLAPGDTDIAEAWIRTRSSCAPGERQAPLALAAELFTALPDAPQAEAYAMALAADGQFERAIQLQRRAAARLDRDYSNELLRRYTDELPATRPWPDDAAVYTMPPTAQ